MKIIGVTGNSGSGKTTFSKILAKKIDAIIIDADKIAKKTSQKGEEYYKKIVELFGKEILKEDDIDRKKLANIIYNNKEKRKELNLLTNNYVVKNIKKEIERNKQKNIIMDVPLLFESKLDKECDFTVSLISDRKIKIDRMIQRDKINEEMANKRLNIQEKDEYYIEKSNYIIVNNNTNLDEEVDEFIRTLDLINNEVVIIKNGKTKYIQLKNLLKYKNIIHCFSLKPMDFGDNKTFKNKEKNIIENYENICNCLNINHKNVVRPYQTHTDNVKKVENETGIYIEKLKNIDGLMTDKKEKVLSLTFADCTPIYVFDKDESVIALVHSGWVGTTKKIIQNAIQKLVEEYNIKPENLICAIGPTIRQCHFEVDKDVKDIFYNEFKYMQNIGKIIKIGEKQGKYYIDTVEINKNLMKENGVLEENIIDCKICSLCNNETIHSYRKDGKNAGRNTAILCLK